MAGPSLIPPPKQRQRHGGGGVPKAGRHASGAHHHHGPARFKAVAPLHNGTSCRLHTRVDRTPGRPLAKAVPHEHQRQAQRGACGETARACQGSGSCHRGWRCDPRLDVETGKYESCGAPVSQLIGARREADLATEGPPVTFSKADASAYAPPPAADLTWDLLATKKLMATTDSHVHFPSPDVRVWRPPPIS